MRHRVLLCLYLCSCIGSLGCPGVDGTGGGRTDSGDPRPPTEGAISGRLSVITPLARSTFLEAEPNDDPADLHLLTTVSVGTRIEVFGDVSTDSGDVTDTFKFQCPQALTVQVVLSFDFAEAIDLGLGVVDGTPLSCTLGPDHQAYSRCHDTGQNPERPVLEVAGDFSIAVKALHGSSNYVMGLEFFDAGTIIPPSHGTVPSDPAGAGVIPDQVLVQFDPQVTPQRRREIIRRRGMELVQQSPAGTALLQTKERTGSVVGARVRTMRAVQSLASVPEVRYAEPNYRFQIAREPDDEYFQFQWHYDLINLPEAWDTTIGSETVVIAVVDTGVLVDHPDLQDRLVDGYDLISDADSARDGDGIDADPNDAGDLSGGPSRSSYHGTHVAGILAAATDNATGVAGVTWACRLMPVRALGVGGGSSFDIAEAVRYAAGLPNASGQVPQQAADIINLSLAAPVGIDAPTTMGNAIAEAVAAGVVVVAAAGNEATGLQSYPAAFGETIAVSACDPQLNLAPYSNFGPTIDLAAPGGNLAVDFTGDGQGDGVLSSAGADSNGSVSMVYSFQHGTSMACPHVSGVVGLMRSIDPGLSVPEVREILSSTARDIGDAGRDDLFGSGVIDAALAVKETARRAGQSPPTEPSLSLSTTTLDFGSTLDQLLVQVTNTGGGTLQVDPQQGVTVQELSGAGWLRLEVQTSSGSSNISAIILQVDRSILADGEYLARVTVESVDRQVAQIQVSVTVGAGDPISDQIFVVAVDATTRSSVAQDVTTAQRGFEYAIDNLPPGTYKVYAGTDRDGDDQICDLGELCGALPSAIRAEDIQVRAGQIRSGFDFAVGELIFQSQTARSFKGPVIRLLD